MFVENVFPPIPSELIMPLAGYLTVSDSMNLWAAITAGFIGSLAGATLWYWVGLRYSKGRFRSFVERHGVWLGMDEHSVDHAQEWFDRHGYKAVFIGRLVPGLRTVISVPAGLSRMPLLPFLLWTAFGTALWTIFLTYAGRFLGERFDVVDKWIGPVSWVVVSALFVWYLYRVVKKYRQQKH